MTQNAAVQRERLREHRSDAPDGLDQLLAAAAEIVDMVLATLDPAIAARLNSGFASGEIRYRLQVDTGPRASWILHALGPQDALRLAEHEGIGDHVEQRLYVACGTTSASVLP